MNGNCELDNIRGFTLIELMVTIAVLGILASISMSIFHSYRDNAYNTELLFYRADFAAGLAAYAIDVDYYVINDAAQSEMSCQTSLGWSCESRNLSDHSNLQELFAHYGHINSENVSVSFIIQKFISDQDLFASVTIGSCRTSYGIQRVFYDGGIADESTKSEFGYGFMIDNREDRGCAMYRNWSHRPD